jgi:hypothetical protein
MKLLSLILAFSAFSAFASDLRYAPPAFVKEGKKYVFTDITQAKYKIVYDIAAKKASVKSQITFNVKEAGYPLIDSVAELRQVSIASNFAKRRTSAKKISLPGGTSQAIAIDQAVGPGTYQVNIESELSRLVTFESTHVRSAMWMSDLTERGFLERYLPTNLDFDHIPMLFDVSVVGTTKKHTLMINCENKLVEANRWVAKCPSYYTSSFLFFHLFEEGHFNIVKYKHRTIDNRVIPVVLYKSGDPSRLVNMTKKLFAELERDYGPWPHDWLIVYNAGSGGMEYSGATMTSTWALGHEMHHSYFARGMGPALGNAGWIDEALASWRDDGYQRGGRLQVTNMAGKSPYVRETDRDAYSAGARFIAQLDKLNANKGGMLKFLKDFYADNEYQSMTTARFQKALDDYFNKDHSDLFKRYIYGNGSKTNKSFYRPSRKSNFAQKVYHPQLSEEELKKLL